MIPDPSPRNPLVGSGSPARDGSHGPSRAGMYCWLCNHPINDPPEIVGRWHTTQARVAHKHCLRILGELDLDLPPAS